MNLSRRSFLRSLGAALLTPLLPKAEPTEAPDEFVSDIYFLPTGYPGTTWIVSEDVELLSHAEFAQAVERAIRKWRGRTQDIDWSTVLWLPNDAKWCVGRLISVTYTAAEDWSISV